MEDYQKQQVYDKFASYTEVKEASPHCRVCGSHPEITDVTKNSGEYEVLSACHR